MEWLISQSLLEILKGRYGLIGVRGARLLAGGERNGWLWSWGALWEFCKCKRLIEILSDLGNAVRGQAWDAGYTLHNLIALENLHSLQVAPTDPLPRAPLP
jgi:hypothetical protein